MYLDNIKYRVDIASFVFYVKNAIEHGNQKILKYVTKTNKYAKQVFDADKGPDEVYELPYKVLCKIAKSIAVPPELLIDEDYYYSESGIASYRIPFLVWEAGMTLDEFVGTNDEVNDTYWHRSWLKFLNGKKLNPTMYDRIIKHCMDKLGVDIPHLIVRPLRTKGSTLLDDLVNILLPLDNKDIAFLVGVGKALRDYKITADEVRFKKDIDKMVRWLHR